MEKESSNTLASNLRQGQAQARLKESPLTFEPNRGQADPQVKFVGRAHGYTVMLTADGAVLHIKRDGILRMKMQNAQPTPRVEAFDPRVGKSNYLIGSDRSEWVTEVPHYGKVRYQDVYPGVDVIYSGNERNLEYDMIVKPGASPNQIRVAFEGASQMTLDRRGDLELKTAAGTSINHKPVVYQQINGQRKPVEGEFVLLGKNEVGFKLGTYDAAQSLVIDPIVQVFAFIGGTGDDQGLAIAANSTGVYLTGKTNTISGAATPFPLTPGTCISGTPPTCTEAAATILQNSKTNGYDVFVTKLSPDGTTLVYSTYLGGSSDDVGTGIAVGSDGSAYVTGFTSSVSNTAPNAAFPVTVGSIAAGSIINAFVAKLTPSGQALAYSVAFGGVANATQAFSIAIDGSGLAYVGGVTSGGLIGAATGIQGGIFGGGATDGFVAKLDAGGNLVASALVGGAGTDQIIAVALDPNKNIVIAGNTSGAGSLPVPSGNKGKTTATATGTNAFLMSVKNDLSALVYTLTFGNGLETATGVAVDTGGVVYVVGGSQSGLAFGGATSGTRPVIAAGSLPTSPNLSSGYLMAFNFDGSYANWIDYLGPQAPLANPNSMNAVAVDNASQAYVIGTTFNPANAGNGTDAWTTRISADGSQNTGATEILGGTGADSGSGVAVNASHEVFFVGSTTSGMTKGAPNALPGTIGLKRGTPPTNNGNIVGTANSGSNDVLFAGIQFNDIFTGQNYLAFTTAAGTSLPPAQFVNASFPANGGTSCVTSAATAVSTTGPNSNGFTVSLVPGTTNVYSVTVTGGTSIPGQAFGMLNLVGCENVMAIPLTFGITTTINAIPTKTLTLTQQLGSGILSPINSTAGNADIFVTIATLGSGSVAYKLSVTDTSSNFPASSGACSDGLISFPNGSIGLTAPPGPAVGVFTVHVSSACAANLAAGTYQANVSVQPDTPNAGAFNTLKLAVQLTVTGGITVTCSPASPCLAPYTFRGNSSPPLTNSATLTASGGSFSYTTTYTPAASAGNNPLPAANVNILAGGSGTLASAGPTTLALQVSPSGLANAAYTGILKVNPSGSSSFNPVTLNVNVLIGSGLIVVSPNAGSLSLSVPALLPDQSGPTIQVGTASATAITIKGTTSASPGITTSANLAGILMFAGSSASNNGDCTIAAGGICSYAMTIDTHATMASTIIGSITVTTSTPSGSSALIATIPVTLQVTQFPNIVATNPTTGLPLTGLTLTALTGPSTVCSGTAGQQPTPTFAATGGFINDVSFTPSVTSGVNFITAPISTGILLNTNPQLRQFCVNPQLLGNRSGTFTGTVIVSSASASNSPLTIPVTLLLTASDVTPPQLTSMSFSPTTVDTSSGPASITVSFAGKDDLSGISQVMVGFLSPSGNWQYDDQGSVSGTTNFAGTATVEFPQFSEAGIWKLGDIRTVDLVGNVKSFSPVEITALVPQNNLMMLASNAGSYRSGFWLGTYRPTSAGPNTAMAFYLDSNGNNAWDATDKVRFFGVTGIPGTTVNDVPVAGDWDGTGVVRFGVFHCPATPQIGACAWFIDLNNNGQWDGTFGGDAIWPNFGFAGDIPVVGDWNGDGKSKIGIMRCPAAGSPEAQRGDPCVWYLDLGNKHTFDPATVGVYFLGVPGDQPAVSKWLSGSPGDQLGVAHCAAGGSCTWTVDSTGKTGTGSAAVPVDLRATATTGATFTPAGGFQAITNNGLGNSGGDIVVIGNWNGNGNKRVGFFRSSTGQWFVDTNGNGTYDPGIDQIINIGLPPSVNPGGVADYPIVGFWTMP
jgi:hypothetical protein